MIASSLFVAAVASSLAAAAPSAADHPIRDRPTSRAEDAQGDSATAAVAKAPVVDEVQAASNVDSSYWYDWGLHGSYPSKSYESFGAKSPLFNIVRDDDRCGDGLLFMEPRGGYVETPGPVVVDARGELVWTETRWGQAMDVKVQSYKGKDYITFWIGEDVGTFAGGTGTYLMLDDHYNVFKEIKPAGNLMGDLHEFSITEKGTALMTIYESVEGTYPGANGDEWTGWLYDCLIQEMDIETGDLIFEWRATDHYHALDSMQPPGRTGGSDNSGWDFFHVNSIDKNDDGDYLISARHMCAVACISHVDGHIMWQLGGRGNSFDDLSDGQATNIAWNHHASYVRGDAAHDSGKGNNSVLVTVFDNESNGQFKSGTHSRGLMVELDLEAMTAKLAREYLSPIGYLAPSQGSVQILPGGTVLVGWGHTPAYTEFTLEGEVLCDVHFGPIWFANFGWVKSYRDFKFPWVGRPDTRPDAAMRPSEQALYVSWNGATEVDRWVLQSANDGSLEDSQDNEDDKKEASAADAASDVAYKTHHAVRKTTFETKMTLPADAGEYVRAVALDASGARLGATRTVSRHEKTVTQLTEAPSRGWKPEPITIFTWSLLAFLMTLAAVHHYRGLLRRVAIGVVGRVLPASWAGSVRSAHKYEPVPLK